MKSFTQKIMFCLSLLGVGVFMPTKLVCAVVVEEIDAKGNVIQTLSTQVQPAQSELDLERGTFTLYGKTIDLTKSTQEILEQLHRASAPAALQVGTTAYLGNLKKARWGFGAMALGGLVNLFCPTPIRFFRIALMVTSPILLYHAYRDMMRGLASVREVKMLLLLKKYENVSNHLCLGTTLRDLRDLLRPSNPANAKSLNDLVKERLKKACELLSGGRIAGGIGGILLGALCSHWDPANLFFSGFTGALLGGLAVTMIGFLRGLLNITMHDATFRVLQEQFEQEAERLRQRSEYQGLHGVRDPQCVVM